MSTVKAGEPISITSGAWERSLNLRLYVVFTDAESTRDAIESATQLTGDLNARLVLLVAKVVPYPLPLESPPVPRAFTDGFLSQLAAEQEADINVRVYLCRDRNQTIRSALEPRSLVLIGRRKSWWPTPAVLLGRLLKRDGHQVVFVDCHRAQQTRSGPVKVESSL